MFRKSEKKYDVCIVGALADCDLVMAEHASLHGLKCCVVRHKIPEYCKPTSDLFEHFDGDDVIYEENIFKRIEIYRSSKLIVSFTGTLLTQLKYLWPLRYFMGLPPVINITTASDITELSIEKTLLGYLYRSYLSYCRVNWCLPLPHAITNIVNNKFKNILFSDGFPFIYYEDYLKDLSLYDREGPLKVFHCSHIDWNYTNHNPKRNHFKWSNEFIYALIKALRKGMDVECTILNRGFDAELAHKLFEKAGLANDPRIIWKEHMDRDELHKTILESDIVANMFGHGGAGGISFESMALGTPVMQRAHRSYFGLMYRSMAPFINCTNSREIYNAFEKYSKDKTLLKDVSIKGREWAAEHIDPKKSMQQFLFLYSYYTGEMRLDLGNYVERVQSHSESIQNGDYDPLDLEKHLDF